MRRTAWRTCPSLNRPPQAEEDVDAAVAAILADVRTRGDDALREYTRRFDGADLQRFEVTAGGAATPPGTVLDAEFPGDAAAWRRTTSGTSMRQQVHRDFCLTDRPGVVLGQRVHPHRAGGHLRARRPGGLPLHHSDERHPRQDRRGAADRRW